MATTNGKSTITLREPSKYATSSSPPPPTFADPPLDWLQRTWSVTHSTLSMWRSARNVRISYSAIAPSPPSSGGSRPRVDDLVEYEKASGKGGVKTVSGIDTAASPSSTGSWDWRGKGLLGFVTSHWEVLGWGERDVDEDEGGGGGGGGAKERWVVTWFAPTLFTREGIDLYSDRREGLSPALAGEILAALKAVEASSIVEMVEKDMKEVEIKLPWKDR